MAAIGATVCARPACTRMTSGARRENGVSRARTTAGTPASRAASTGATDTVEFTSTSSMRSRRMRRHRRSACWTVRAPRLSHRPGAFVHSGIDGTPPTTRPYAANRARSGPGPTAIVRSCAAARNRASSSAISDAPPRSPVCTVSSSRGMSCYRS